MDDSSARQRSGAFGRCDKTPEVFWVLRGDLITARFDAAKSLARLDDDTLLTTLLQEVG
jgi:hypothetical protein